MVERSKLGILCLLVLFFANDLIPVAKGFQTQNPRARKKEDARHDRQQRIESVAEGGATTASPLGLPFKRLWEYLPDNPSNLPPTLDHGRIYLPLNDGRVICLDSQSGSLLWSAEPGGILDAPVAVGEKAVYIVSEKKTTPGAESSGSVRALDPATGVTLWAHDYQRPFTSPVATTADRLYAGSADGSLYSLSAAGGDVVWKAATQNIVRGLALVTDNAVYFGSDDGALHSVVAASGLEEWKYQTQGAVIGRPVADDSAIYFGSSDGYVYAVYTETGKLRWRSPTSAAVETAPVITGDRLLVASLDDFVYALSKSKGDRIWKRRMDSRIAATPIIEGDANMVAPLRGNHVAVFLNSDGRRVNLYQLEQGFELVAGPIFSDGLLFLATDKGLVVAKSFKKPENPDSKNVSKK